MSTVLESNAVTNIGEKGDMFAYGFGPLIAAIISIDQVSRYPSCLSVTTHLSAVSCLYSLLALSCQILSSGSKMIQSHKGKSIKMTPTMLLKQVFTLEDVAKDPRFLALALTTFIKIWFSLRLIKALKHSTIFFFVAYADTFVQLLLDQALSLVSQRTSTESKKETDLEGQATAPTSGDQETSKKPQAPTDSITPSQLIGVIIWLLGVLLLVVVQQDASFVYKVVLYLGVCACEVYLLKHCTCSPEQVQEIIKFCDKNSYRMQFIPSSLIPKVEDLNDRTHRWGEPLDMDLKLNKITYQKCRVLTILVFAAIDELFLGAMSLVFGKENFGYRQSDLPGFLILVAVIVFRQKYELQICHKYRLDNLAFGKVFFLPTIYVFSILGMVIGYNKMSNTSLLVGTVFLAAYANFFWDKACRKLGLN